MVEFDPDGIPVCPGCKTSVTVDYDPLTHWYYCRECGKLILKD